MVIPYPTIFNTLLPSLLCASWCMLAVVSAFAHVHVLAARLLEPEVTTHKSESVIHGPLCSALLSLSLSLLCSALSLYVSLFLYISAAEGFVVET